jgi:hypothetical protein
MIVLFVGAMALIFYILLLRAQHLSSMEQQRENPQPESMIEQPAAASMPMIMHSPIPGAEPEPHILGYLSAA